MTEAVNFLLRICCAGHCLSGRSSVLLCSPLCPVSRTGPAHGGEKAAVPRSCARQGRRDQRLFGAEGQGRAAPRITRQLGNIDFTPRGGAGAAPPSPGARVAGLNPASCPDAAGCPCPPAHFTTCQKSAWASARLRYGARVPPPSHSFALAARPPWSS